MQSLVVEHWPAQSLRDVRRFFKLVPGKSQDRAEEWGLSFQMIGETLIILPGNTPQTLPRSVIGKESSMVTFPSLKKHVPPSSSFQTKCVQFAAF